MILFRKEAEKILQDHGFSEDFIVSRIDKHIWLVGKCGKQIIQVSDLKIGNKLTKAERELLIEDYLYPNVIVQKTKINKLLTLEAEVKNLQKERDEIAEKEGVHIKSGYYNEIKLITSTLGFMENVSTSSEVEQIDPKTHELKPKEHKLIITGSSDKEVLDILDFFKSKRPIRKKVLDLYKKEDNLVEEIIKIKKELKIIC